MTQYFLQCFRIPVRLLKPVQALDQALLEKRVIQAVQHCIQKQSRHYATTQSTLTEVLA